MKTMDIKQQVIDRFNELLGTDLKNLDKMGQFHEQLLLEKRQIEESLTMASTEAPSKIKAAVANVELIKSDVENSIEMSQKLQESISESIQRDNKTKSIETIINSLEELERGLSYLSLIKSVDTLSNEIESAMASGNDKTMINSFSNLVEINCQLETSNCQNLVNFVRETLHFWHSHLKEKFSKEYMDVLKTLKWPFCGDNLSILTSPNSDALNKFKLLTEYLLQLQLPQETDKSSVKSNVLADFLPVSLPINLLVRPLRQRFVFHFTGSKQTNRRDKPEWYFTQILSWIRDHEVWIERNVQPVFNSSDFSYINAKVEFMRALVQLAVEKLHSDVPVVQYDDALFAHLVDEALAFERDLRENLFYPPSQPATVSVLTQAQSFVKWINMEKKYATEKMDAILSAQSAWERISIANVENIKVTECAEAFLNLLTTMNERYSHLPQPGHRLQFLELQLELIDDWRVRLLQLLHQGCEDPLNSIIPSILNSVHYVLSVLTEWGVTVHFLQLHYFKKQCEAADEATDLGLDFLDDSAEESGTVFDDAVALLKRLETELLGEISDSVALEVKARSRPYRTDKWFTMQNDKEVASLSVTPSGCLMFEELALRLHAMNEALSLSLFNQAWRNVAALLDQYLFEGVVLENQFNAGGSIQLKYDITRNLFPLFGLYTNKPESFFPLLRESCLLLNMLLGSVMLLMEVLEGGTEEAAKEVLADVGVFSLSPSSALLVLKARTDVAMQ